MHPWRKIKELFAGKDAPPPAKPPGPKLSASEQRYTVRRQQRLSQGYLWSEHMASSKPCSIRNISATGARIDLLSGGVKTHATVGTMTLYFPAEKREIDCEVMWRSGRSLGLRFTGPYRPPTRKYGV